MSIHSVLRNLTSEVTHFKNKYKFVILKITMMPQIKEAFVGSNVNTISTLQYSIKSCSDVSFICIIFSRNWHLLPVLNLLISDLTFVFSLLSLLVTNWYMFILIFRRSFFRFMSEKNCSHKYVLPNFKHIWRTN